METIFPVIIDTVIEFTLKQNSSTLEVWGFRKINFITINTTFIGSVSAMQPEPKGKFILVFECMKVLKPTSFIVFKKKYYIHIKKKIKAILLKILNHLDD